MHSNAAMCDPLFLTCLCDILYDNREHMKENYSQKCIFFSCHCESGADK